MFSKKSELRDKVFKHLHGECSISKVYASTLGVFVHVTLKNIEFSKISPMSKTLNLFEKHSKKYIVSAHINSWTTFEKDTFLNVYIGTEKDEFDNWSEQYHTKELIMNLMSNDLFGEYAVEKTFRNDNSYKTSIYIDVH